ncbi:MAG: hypothetical protein EAZ24_11395 [Burkholderiales bacterium]|nr:MAG: hypothetical protein EAZ24_11395 [Burkholderiales bacterium]TAG79993.1 MAG: hypothetical protein EAZ21_09150 [Betaproteobacteria bacterium]
MQWRVKIGCRLQRSTAANVACAIGPGRRRKMRPFVPPMRRSLEHQFVIVANVASPQVRSSEQRCFQATW